MDPDLYWLSMRLLCVPPGEMVTVTVDPFELFMVPEEQLGSPSNKDTIAAPVAILKGILDHRRLFGGAR